MNRSIRPLVALSVTWAALHIAGASASRAEETVNLPKPNSTGSLTRVVESQGFRVELDLTGQVLDAKAEIYGFYRHGISIGEEDTIEIVAETPLIDGDAEVARLKPGRRFVVVEGKRQTLTIQVLIDGNVRQGSVATADVKQIDVPIRRIQKALIDGYGGDFVSVGMLASKAKQFDDGLYAAVELAAQNGAGDFAGKKQLLTSLLRSLSQSPATVAAGKIAGAAHLGQTGAVMSPELQKTGAAEAQTFLADEMSSKPLGFYTWSDELSRIFQQDRLLQTPLTAAEGADAIVAALRADEAANQTYARYLALVGRLTNPWDYPDFRAAVLNAKAALDTGKEYRFFPPSRSHEADLVKRLYGNQPIPDGFDLMTELIGRIRKGSIDLKPTDQSGWYDRQTYSLETLVVPARAAEASKIRYDDEYRRLLADYFKAALALARETHVKQSYIARGGAAAPSPRVKIYVGPELSVEPTATHYRRRADAYRFVHGVLRETFGAAGLKTMRRLTADGPVENDLDSELAQMTALFDGAAHTAARQLGMNHVGAPLADQSDESAINACSAWTAGIKKDPDLSRDARMMVPVFYDVGRKKMKVWVFLGWTSRDVTYRYATPPNARVFDAQGSPVNLDDPAGPELVWIADRHQVSVPVVEEVYVSKLLNREEFRRHCDVYRTREAILSNLE